jgi:hypothetical protein
MNVNVEFPDETINQMKSTTRSIAKTLDNNPEQGLHSIVQNAMRVYMQLRQIAKDNRSITVISDGKRYTISLE